MQKDGGWRLWVVWRLSALFPLPNVLPHANFARPSTVNARLSFDYQHYQTPRQTDSRQAPRIARTGPYARVPPRLSRLSRRLTGPRRRWAITTPPKIRLPQLASRRSRRGMARPARSRPLPSLRRSHIAPRSSPSSSRSARVVVNLSMPRRRSANSGIARPKLPSASVVPSTSSNWRVLSSTMRRRCRPCSRTTAVPLMSV